MVVGGRKITIVGCGPGSSEYITGAGLWAIREAEVLVGAGRLLETFAPEGVELIEVGADIPGVLEEIAAKSKRRKVTVLVTGDPGLSSLARPVLRRFGRENCEIIPGISSIQTAFARLGLDWLDAMIVGAHGGRPEIEIESLPRYGKIAVLAGGADDGWIADAAKALGGGYRIYLCRDLTLESERITRIEADELGAAAITQRAVIVFVKEAVCE